MLIIGCDYHPGFQQIALVDTETGVEEGRRLQHQQTELASRLSVKGNCPFHVR
jgi:hypothetical protein